MDEASTCAQRAHGLASERNLHQSKTAQGSSGDCLRNSSVIVLSELLEEDAGGSGEGNQARPHRINGILSFQGQVAFRYMKGSGVF